MGMRQSWSIHVEQFGATVTSDYIKAGERAAKFAGDDALMPWLVQGGEDN